MFVRIWLCLFGVGWFFRDAVIEISTASEKFVFFLHYSYCFCRCYQRHLSVIMSWFLPTQRCFTLKEKKPEAEETKKSEDKEDDEEEDSDKEVDGADIQQA